MRLVFGSFELDLEASRLLRDGQDVALEPRAFALLLYLAQHPGRLLTRDELLREVWQAQSLSSGVTSNAIAKLRIALGQDSEERAPIETVHGRGYRFHLQPPVAPAATRSPVTAPQAPEDPFLGRTKLFELLSEKLERTKAGTGCLVLLAGSAGMGKTRTAKELASHARARGVRVGVGAAYDGAGLLAYWPWIQVLRSLQQELGRTLWERCVPRDAQALWQLLPELRPAQDPNVPLEPSAARFKLFDEITRLLSVASDGTPLLLLLDDLQWADEGSLELLAFAARALRSCRVMFLAGAREDEVATHAARRSALRSLAHAGARLSLAPLSLAAATALAQVVAGPERVSAEIAGTIHERSGGNPFFVRQLAELVQHAESIEPAELSRALPPAVFHVLRQKLALLEPDTLTIVAAASVIGEEFGLSLLADVQALPEPRVLAALEPALRLHVLAPVEGTENFAFTHALLREALCQELDVAERGALHKRVADALAKRAAAGLTVNLGEVARHYLEAVPSCLEQALHACRAAAAAALAAAGFESACELLDRALRKWEAERGDLETRFTLLVELGVIHFVSSSFVRAWEAHREAAETARQLNRADLLAQAVPHLVNCVDTVAGDVAFARAALEQALSGLSDGQDALRAVLLGQRAELAVELSAPERAALLREAAACAERSDALFARIEVAHSRTNLRDPTTLAENAAAAAALLDLLQRFPADPGAGSQRTVRTFSAYMTQYLCALTQCDLAGADRVRPHLQELAERSRLRTARVLADWVDLGRALGDGRLAEAENLLKVATSTLQASDGPLIGSVYGWFFGSLIEAQARFDELARFDPSGALTLDTSVAKRADVLIVLARLCALTGKHERARDYFAQIARADLARMPVRHGDLGALCALAEAYCTLEDREGAAWLYPRLSPFAERNAVLGNFEYWGAVAHYLGLLARFLGEKHTAREHFARALVINRDLNMPLRIAQTERALASV